MKLSCFVMIHPDGKIVEPPFQLWMGQDKVDIVLYKTVWHTK